MTEESVGCVYETEDDDHHRGVRLSKELVKVAGRAMEKNFTSLGMICIYIYNIYIICIYIKGPYVLPVSEQLNTVFWMFVRHIAKQFTKAGVMKPVKIDPYIPDFKRGIDHFCIHAGDINIYT